MVISALDDIDIWPALRSSRQYDLFMDHCIKNEDWHDKYKEQKNVKIVSTLLS